MLENTDSDWRLFYIFRILNNNYLTNRYMEQSIHGQQQIVITHHI